MLNIDNNECNDNTRKLRSVFRTYINKHPIQTLIDTGSTITAISTKALENASSDITLYKSKKNQLQ